MEFLDGFIERLEATVEGDEDKYNGADYLEAWKLLPDDITEPIPLCMYYPAKDDDPMRMPRMEAICVLAYVMAKRKRADITLEQVQGMIHNRNLRSVVRDIWRFWSDAVPEEIDDQVDNIDMEVESEEASPLEASQS